MRRDPIRWPWEKARTAVSDHRIIEKMPSGSPFGRPPHGGVKPAAPLLPAVKVALDRVERHVASGRRDVLLLGPPGVGKTLLLRRLAARPFRPGRVFYCPFLHFEPQEATRWLLALVGLPMDAGEGRLVRELVRGGRLWAPNLLLLDEAQTIPEDTLRHLAALFRRGDRALSRVWAGIDGSALHRVPRVVGMDMPRVALFHRRAESGFRAGLEAIPREQWLSTWERRAVKIPATRRPKPLHDVPLELPRVLDGQASGGMSGKQGALSDLPAVRHLADPVAGARRTPLAALPPSPEPAASAVAGRLGRPGRVMSRWRHAWIAASAAVVAGLITGSFSILSRTPEPTGAPALPAVAAAPVLVDINAVPWAHIVVDGREVGATPIGDLSMAPGTHRIQARFRYGESAVRTVEVSDENRRVGFRGASAGQIGQ